MAHFERPKGKDPSNFDLNKETENPVDIWRMRVTEKTFAQICLWGGSGLKIVSDNPHIVPNHNIEIVDQPEHRRLITLYGQYPGTSEIHAGTGKYGTKSWRDHSMSLQVNVLPNTRAKVVITQLTKPHVAVNSHNTPVVYRMSKNIRIKKSESPEDIIKKIASAGSANHLAISAHGKPGELGLGTGLTPANLELFEQLRGKFGVIWMGSCFIGGGSNNSFPGDIAKKTKSYVITAGGPVPAINNVRLKVGEIGLQQRSLLRVNTPTGKLIPYAEFIGYQKTLKFKQFTV